MTALHPPVRRTRARVLTGCVFFLAALLLPLWIAPLSAWAWGPDGHRIVALLADAQLQPELRKKYQRDFNIRDLAEIANWADQVKRQRSQQTWHYLNLPQGARNYRRERDCPDGHCVLEKIHEFSRILKDPAQSRTARKEALMYLVHFVADIHQPLHLGYAEDRGGNEVPLELAGQETNLHALWDEGLIPAGDLVQYSRNLNERIAPAVRARWAGASVTEWALESRALVLYHVYRFGPGTALSQSYVHKSQEIIALRLSQAGVRLAKLLNTLLE